MSSLGCKADSLPQIVSKINELAKHLPHSRNVDSSTSADASTNVQVGGTLQPRVTDQERSVFGADDSRKVMDEKQLGSQSSLGSFSDVTDLLTSPTTEEVTFCQQSAAGQSVLL